MYSCTSEGQPLVEVFGVHFHGGEAPAGTITVYDGKRGQIIYSGIPVQKPYSQTQRSGLRLTGPYRAISADGCVAIVLDLHDRPQASSSSPSSYVAEIILDVYDENTRYDQAITHSVSSTSGDGDGDVEVTYALLSDAVEAIVEVKLLGPEDTIGGTVVARTDLGEVVLFEDHGAGVGTGTEEEAAGVIPLGRSVVAVPLTSSLTVEVDLVVDGNLQQVVKESLVCVPKVGSEEVCRRPIGGVASVEVKVTWLD